MPVVDLAYQDSGAGPVVLLLHAFPLDHRMWESQRAALASHARVIAPDLRGWGASPIGDDEPSLSLMADDLAALLDRLEIERAIVAGLSLGGYVAMALARQHAQRISGLALLDTKATPDADAARNNRERIARTILDEGTPRVLFDDVLPGLVGSTTHSARPEVVATVRELLAQAPPESVAWTQRAMAGRPDSVPTLEEVQEPSLVVVGDEDVLAPMAEAEIMLDALPEAELAVIPQCGHLSAMERPEVVTALLTDFIDDVTRA